MIENALRIHDSKVKSSYVRMRLSKVWDQSWGMDGEQAEERRDKTIHICFDSCLR